MKLLIALIVTSTACTPHDSMPPATKEQTLAEAKSDFDAALKGKPPLYAVVDTSQPDNGEDGTKFYKGRGYSLTVKKKLAMSGDRLGYMYGPSVTFKDAAVEKEHEIKSEIKFYLMNDLEKLNQK